LTSAPVLGLSARLPPASSRQLPITSPEEWHSVASGVEAVDLDLVAADHQVRVDVGAVDAHAPQFVVRETLRQILERAEDGGAVGDVAGGVLVQKEVVKQRVELADPRPVVDERDLAEVPRPLDTSSAGRLGM
jgi:hypothetical protein